MRHAPLYSQEITSSKNTKAYEKMERLILIALVIADTSAVFSDDRWVEVELEANPTIQRRFQLPTPAPYIPDVDIPGVGGKEFNEVTNIRCPLSSEKE